MWGLETTSHFRRKYRKLANKNSALKNKIQESIKLLTKDPRHNKLKSHKVITKEHGEAISSYVTGDIRVIWQRLDDKLVLLLLDIGGHSGSKAVY